MTKRRLIGRLCFGNGAKDKSTRERSLRGDCTRNVFSPVELIGIYKNEPAGYFICAHSEMKNYGFSFLSLHLIIMLCV
ncbi:MAG: hypothetical protein UU49_C0005G0052 [Candidatus Magasanikbacteria bacterium GW2011_GWC2_41_17]|uniref:Uncharacterized protein n=2 Tax=Candidatus Magasanikiibacteriota TaxID=1752731 RepID=A0A0G0ZKR4_9BACT|nr:MAG: hypothetical protein UU49_C0005G0052 [Candidatus Magasanikbacteria bacterium GW2011_GWC2_41_17]KKS13578.1 MAG: hypothetical protein UU69_C0002G0013 [Candidatus Magasanikbacteria bacterium GW2011_GWA2_41_55]